ncbi:glycerol-3-phosphate dehydrogenase/oxidase [Oceaniglobus indicus]|uniref:glycerol-3-phosphate dehydrogenase/oxidase n=1 Tax=Oceaniglobus indicus TaxID=2047749 RepID=UPI000C194A56|nr:glycerol-3-phosphate dehydrogenase/oxidase [Oceaniglobus indicus]
MPKQRQTALDAVRANPAFDVVVVGGGINGIGVYRDLALQGLRVLLIERRDFCSGCSAAPSRMIHGGLRYLENGEFDLVRESLEERDILLRQAAHMVRPLPTVIPITGVLSGTLNAAMTFLGRSGKPARRGALPIRLGLSLYDWVTRKRRLLPRHRFLGRAATRREWPALPRETRYAAIYHDAWISHPERLGLELIAEAARGASGSVALNYSDIVPEGDGFTLTDGETGSRFPVMARCVVNATGAWLDRTRAILSPQAAAAPLVSGTKGSHLILDNPSLFAALDGHMVFYENDDGRVCIVFPYLGRVLAGSTDIAVKSPTRTRCEPDERDYMLNALGRIFPGIAIAPDQIVFSYSGIRPLPVSDQDYTGRISRGHDVRRMDGAVPQFCMVGGKWTTFRAFAAQTADQVLAELGRPRKADTRALPIGGGDGFPHDPADLVQELGTAFGVGPARAAHLVGLHGTGARDVLASCADRDDAPLVTGGVMTRGDILYMVQHENAVHLADLVLRRTGLAITGVISSDLIDAINAVMASAWGWSDGRAADERAALLDELETYHGVTAAMLAERSRTSQCNDRSLQCV